MAGPMDGVRVVELAFWVAGPAASGILADWGADVIKIEPPTGDPWRGLRTARTDDDENFAFPLDNRGKRSIALDLSTEKGRQLAATLIDQADVFVTNLRPRALESLGFGSDHLTARNPALIYALATGYGTEGPEANRPSYDAGAFWSRSGMAHALTAPGDEPSIQRAAMGDHIAGLTLAGGIAAALHARSQTGRGQVVTTSLFRVGAYVLSFDLMMNLGGVDTVPYARRNLPNPLMNSFRTSDDKWFWLLCLQADRHWPDVLRAIERTDLLDDDRFATTASRATHRADLLKLLEEAFATRPLVMWAEIFDREDVWWAPVQATHDLLDDPQAEPAGLFVEVPTSDGSARMVATPCDFSDTAWAPTNTSPEIGQHTEEVLLELGYDWEQIGELAGEGVIP